MNVTFLFKTRRQKTPQKVESKQNHLTNEKNAHVWRYKIYTQRARGGALRLSSFVSRSRGKRLFHARPQTQIKHWVRGEDKRVRGFCLDEQCWPHRAGPVRLSLDLDLSCFLNRVTLGSEEDINDLPHLHHNYLLSKGHTTVIQWNPQTVLLPW